VQTAGGVWWGIVVVVLVDVDVLEEVVVVDPDGLTDVDWFGLVEGGG
jgi:hypothetical protein